MIYSVQYLRGIAALMVVLHHIEIKAKQYNVFSLDGFNIGYFGVDLFFIISGFIMCHTTHEKEISFTKFMSARIKRILPLYWLITSIALIIFLVMPSVINSGGGTTSIWASYFLFPSGDRYLVDNGWTLSYEFYFYLIFGTVLCIGSKYKGLVIGSIIFSLVILGLYLEKKNPLLKFSTNVLLLEFVMGIFSFYILKKKIINKFLAMTLIISGITILVVQNSIGVIQTPFYRAVYAGLPMLMIFVGVVAFENFFKTSSSKIFKMTEVLGDISFSLYLVHPFVLSPGAMILKKVGIVNWSVTFTSLLLAGSILAGFICYKYVEIPITNLLKKKK